MNIAQPAQAARSSEAPLSFLQNIFGEKKARAAWAPLYRAIVERARDPFWYRDGGVPDTLDGRFDMVAAVTALVLIRLEALGEAGRRPGVLLTELFVEDMDATMRQIGVGDYVVGKHVGRMVSALGGRLAAFREGDFAATVRRNVFHDAPPWDAAAALVAGRLGRFAAGLDALGLDALAEGALP
ncbi:MAG TPA: ubiquinol-cytochrome C chaperone family protein [Allosphingosinicella sp.]|nr:ubiquinol-cytochrome C chaperone family protein [Allosphingosinicella sp.]